MKIKLAQIKFILMNIILVFICNSCASLSSYKEYDYDAPIENLSGNYLTEQGIAVKL